MATKAQIKAAEVLANRRAAFEKKVRSLLGHVGFKLKRSEIDAAFAKADQYSYSEVAEAFAAEVASREPVGAAVHALKAEAVAHAEQQARDRVARVLKGLAEAGGDQNAYAPYPRQRGWRMTPDEEAARDKHNFVGQITKPDESKGYQSYSTDPDRPYYRVPDEERIERFVNDHREMVAIQYDMFICKMVGKVGEVASAKLDGSHVWSYSFLDVIKPDGSGERWKTQQIVNYTKYGKPYYQWPSRIVKGKG
jgi:hypothetical protein